MAKWFTVEKLESLNIKKEELSNSIVSIFETIENVKDRDSMVSFAESILGIKKLKAEDKLLIAAFDPRLTGSKAASYIEELKSFRFIPTTPRAALPLIYLNTYGEDEIEGRRGEDGKIPMNEADFEFLKEQEKKYANLNATEEEKTVKTESASEKADAITTASTTGDANNSK